MSQSQINTNLAAYLGFCSGLISAEHGHKEAVRGVLADRDSCHDSGLRDGARKADIQRDIHLRNAKFLSVPLERAGPYLLGLKAGVSRRL